jgi:putative glycosyltransferase (TIGR04372 family)
MNKKLRIIISEPLLLIALPVSLISLLTIILAKPFVKIKIGLLHCDRIGHFAANTELYLCERDFKKRNEKTLDLFYFPREVCNQQLARMWERKLHVLPWFWLRPLCLIVRSFNCLASCRVMEGRGGDRDLDNLLDQVPTHLEFTVEEERLGKAKLELMGVPEGEPFVCLTVRDNAYLTQLYKGGNASYHNYRDSNIQNFILAAEELAGRGYFVIRMGAKVNEALKSTHPRIIDYATNGVRSDFMDIYLGANCEFCISTSTGFDAIPFIFRRPIVFVNSVPPGWFHTSRKQFIAITKHHFSVQENRELTLKEIFNSSVGFCGSSVDYAAKEVNLIENTPEEIRDVVLEMSDRLNRSWEPHEDDEELQRKFWEIFPGDAVGRGGVPLHGEIRSHYGANFLRENRWWLE